ncbi:hypothetical protein ACFYO0_14415 [Streptomyces sp. NPDC006365]|uniref:hypothetical protein n=1 Tax=Streptomyces sp. NPDC006365 TaxID=3364744 RepID=UPI0036B84DDF
MTIEITEPTAQVSVPDTARFDEQAPAIEALAELSQMFGHLPRPYITINRFSQGMGLQLDSPSAFEQWRTALQIAPDSVEAHDNKTNAWLAADGVFRGVAVRLTGFGLALPSEQDDAAAVSA